MSRIFVELEQVVRTLNKDIFKSGLVFSTFGNVSAIDRTLGVVAIKPSGISFSKLDTTPMVIVNLNGKIVEGDLRPSSDLKTHLLLYKNFPNIGGVVHTHSTYATAWAQAKLPIPVLGTTHADHLAFDIPCTKDMTPEMIKGDYETETGNQIIEAFADISYEEIQMVLVASHGPFTWGKTAQEAVNNAKILEELAKMALLSLQINPDLKRISPELIQKHYERKHGKDAYYGQKSQMGK